MIFLMIDFKYNHTDMKINIVDLIIMILIWINLIEISTLDEIIQDEL